MKQARTMRFVVFLVFSVLTFTPGAFATGVTFTCNSNINSLATANGYGGSLCNSFQSVVGGSYSSLFTNANASIYIEFNPAVPGLLGGSTSGPAGNFVDYSTYRNALVTASSGDTVDTGALASLPATLPAVYDGTNRTADIELTSALVQALGITHTINGGPNIQGVDSTGSNSCTIGNAGCYNGWIELGAPANLSYGQGYWYGTGTQQGNQYDIYSIVEHEVNEILGTSSCISTQAGSLTVACGVTQDSVTTQGVAAVDLFRYDATNSQRAAYPTTDQAYFSYSGGTTVDAYYNHSGNGEDYADFNTMDTGTSYNCQYVQDAQGCLGMALDNATDGGAEVTILDAVGYTALETPEPGTIVLLASGLGLCALNRRRLLRIR